MRLRGKKTSASNYKFGTLIVPLNSKTHYYETKKEKNQTYNHPRRLHQSVTNRKSRSRNGNQRARLPRNKPHSQIKEDLYPQVKAQR